MDLVDTDVLIDVQGGHPPALAWFAGRTDLPRSRAVRTENADSRDA